ncbi:hypothetical protein [Streptomyces sp. SM12]|uniref:hypothetical protein n=1 Tax=Streptomyces sp. SM12 TaxID=1071602 RepID=UPI0011B0B65B|nr:hypothetical protein [Streptomyces sp. SM12]
MADQTRPSDSGGRRADMTAAEAAAAARLVAEAFSESTPAATSYRDHTRVPTYGAAAPHTQPGRPPMSARATDHVALVLAYSLGSVPVGGAVALVLWSLSAVNPATLVVAAAAPPLAITAIGIAVKLIGRAVADTAAALPDTTVHHHHGPTEIHHRELNVTTSTRWFGTTRNELPGQR